MIIERCNASLSFRQEVMNACARDFLFYCNVFCWTHNPKDYADSPVRPMLTHNFQDIAADKLIDSYAKYDLCITKARTMGATWMCCLVIEWRWKFYEYQSALICSRKDEFVDGDSRSLFWKIDFVQTYQPSWLRGQINRTKKHMEKLETNSSIDGEATVEDIGRGDRRNILFLDERASIPNGYAVERSTRDMTNCRWNNSTPKGMGGDARAFYEISRKASVAQLRFPWYDHPEYAEGLYTSDRGQLIRLDPNYQYPPDYPFVLDGEQSDRLGYDFRIGGRKKRLRSPWFDEQCRRALSNQEIAQELEMDFLASGSPFFDVQSIEQLIELTVRAPLLEGIVRHSSGENLDEAFYEPEQGDRRFKLWIPVGRNGKPVNRSEYCVSCDIATGAGGDMSSNSVMTVWDRVTGIKVGEYACPYINPEDFCELAVATCKMFFDAFLIFETNGPGRNFLKRLHQIGYPNVFYRGDEEKKHGKKQRKMGWTSTKATKLQLFGEYRRALQAHEITNPSELALKECMEYEHDENGGVSHSGEHVAEDPANRGENHGDRVVSDALANRAMREFPRDERHTTRKAKPVPHNSFEGRRKRREGKEKSREGW